jgi:hypothetical protein
MVESPLRISDECKPRGSDDNYFPFHERAKIAPPREKLNQRDKLYSVPILYSLYGFHV